MSLDQSLLPIYSILAVECQQSFGLNLQTLNNRVQYSCISRSSQTSSLTVGLFTMELSILTCWISRSYFLCYTVYYFEDASLKFPEEAHLKLLSKMSIVGFSSFQSSLANFRSCFPNVWPNLLHLFLLHVVTESYYIIPDSTQWILAFLCSLMAAW